MMCQRPDCAYVHPTFAKYMYQNQMKKKGKGGPHSGPYGGPHGHGPHHGHGPRKVKESETTE